MSTPAPVTWVIGYDCTHDELPHLPYPNAQLAGYVTQVGTTAGIEWTAGDWSAHPNAVRIAQSPDLTVDENTHADVLDYEAGAATLDDIVPWSHSALNSWRDGVRPGQRTPLIYASADNLTPIANRLVTAGLVNGEVGFWVAHWGVSQAQAIADVVNAGGNWPIHAFQFKSDGSFDSDVFSTAWLKNVSTKPVPPPPPAPPPPPKPVAVSLTITFSDKSVREIPL